MRQTPILPPARPGGRRTLLRIGTALFLALAPVHPAIAQQAEAPLSVPVAFVGGEAEYRALLLPGQQIDYLLEAGGGERLHVDLVSDTGEVGFDILQGETVLWRAEAGSVFTGALPVAGSWTVRLRGVGAEAQGAFRVYLELGEAGAPEPADLPALVDAPQPPVLPAPDAPPFADPEAAVPEDLPPSPAEPQPEPQPGPQSGPEPDAAGGDPDPADPQPDGDTDAPHAPEAAAEGAGPEAPADATGDGPAGAEGSSPPAEPPASPVEAQAGDMPADAASGGAVPAPAEDTLVAAGWYVVRALGGDMLNLRRGPSRLEPVVAQVGEGRLLQASGCQEGDGLLWCRVAASDDAAIWGWAAEQFLRPAEDPAIGLEPDGQ